MTSNSRPWHVALKGFALFALALATVTLTRAGAVHDSLTLNGVAVHVVLSREYYVGALYLPTPSNDPSIVQAMDGPKRMELRVTEEKWSPRRFSELWNQALFINNDGNELNAMAKEVHAFTNVLKDDLVYGDKVQIDYTPGGDTTIAINGTTLVTLRSDKFFNALVKTWVGQRPPSSDFKKGILNGTQDAETQELVGRFEAITPEPGRDAAIAAWAPGKPEIKPEEKVTEKPKKEEPKPAEKVVKKEEAKPIAPKAPEVKAATAIAATTSTVTSAVTAAKPSLPNPTAASTKTEVAISKPAAPTPAAVKPVTPAKPVETNKPTEPPKPAVVESAKPVEAPKPTAVEAPKPPAPTPVVTQTPTTSPAPASVSAKVADIQPMSKDNDAAKIEGLKNIYRANMLRMTYRHVVYPSRALERGQEGDVIMLVTLDSKGKVLKKSFEKQSEHALLNKAAEKAVESASYPEAPKQLTGNSFTYRVPIKFRIPEN